MCAAGFGTYRRRSVQRSGTGRSVGKHSPSRASTAGRSFARFCAVFVGGGERVPKWRRSGPLTGEPFGVSLSLFSEVLSGTARSRQGGAVRSEEHTSELQ